MILKFRAVKISKEVSLTSSVLSNMLYGINSLVPLIRSSSPWGAVEDGCFFDVAEAPFLVFGNLIEQSVTLKMMIFDQSWCCWIIPTPIAGSVFGASFFCILEGHCPPFLMFESSKMMFILFNDNKRSSSHFNWDTNFALLEDTGATHYDSQLERTIFLAWESSSISTD